MLDFIYKLAIMLIPFDNLFFAPSRGWATISPILFFIYNVLNIKSTLYIIIKKEYKVVIVIYFLVTYSFGLYLINGIELSNFIDAIQSIILGISFYIAIINRYVIKKNNLEKDICILIKAYYASFIYGLIKYISLELNINSLLNLFKVIEKRYYDRVAFSFTEPSFIAMHVFGVMLPVYYLTKGRKNKKNIIILIILFSILTIVSKSTTRFIIDILFITIIFIGYLIFNKEIKIKYKAIAIYFLTFFMILSPIFLIKLIDSNTRFKNIIEQGIYADSSLASRYFRVNASIKGYINKPDKVLWGAGIGNSYIFLQSGYDEAFSEYKNNYVKEVLSIKDNKQAELFSMPIRLISEFGFIITLILFFILIIYSMKNKSNLFLFIVTLYLYIQFDSYAFYSIWIYIYYCKYRECKNEFLINKETTKNIKNEEKSNETTFSDSIYTCI